MSDEQLFNSKSEPIPPLRQDLQIIPVKENGTALLYFHDERGYATSNFALRREAGQLLSLFNGRKSINDLESQLGNNVSKDDLLDFIQFLDKNKLLNSDFFDHQAEQIEAEYEKSTLHKSVTAGNSYPADPKELKDYLDEAFASHADENIKSVDTAKALYAPHIDPRVALDSYVKAFTSIRDLKPKRVVMLATSHYAGLYPDLYQNDPFILINKDFKMPFGTIPRDQEAIKELKQADANMGISSNDRAHRMEHSLELHLLFLSYLWDHEYEIVPFVIRGMDDLYYMEDGYLGQQLENFSTLMNKKYGDDKDTFFLISGDLAHIGKKFGDESPASTMFNEIEHFDKHFLDYGSNNDRESMLALMKDEYDPYRICGFPPLYTFLQTMPNVQGEILSYDLWDECERDSAVTFGSILYSDQ
ncbi:AmmeMemoRadiSam system protein B [Fodinibius sp.]|uniref:AmmeMemoRadiSam system protein B n=1 Tax=Fodinibius sp. TaxID=1872440 RepID=UPI002ACE9DDD|nr:AmmeMemoRadiSam system protein B [Fodinibius sp.]MDZ7659528.1 AmmeMemoRadiSam system protein B [Fodinibius sp.]